MWNLLLAKVAPFKMYFYIALVIVFLGMAGAIAFLWHSNGELNKELATAQSDLKLAREINYRLDFSKTNAENTNTDIFVQKQGLEAEYKDTADYLTSAWNEYNTQKCGKSNPVPKKTVPGTAPADVDVVIRKTIIDSAWKAYCIADKTVTGCTP